MLKFTLKPEDLSYVTENGDPEAFKGAVELALGGNLPDEPNKTSGNVVKKIVMIE